MTGAFLGLLNVLTKEQVMKVMLEGMTAPNITCKYCGGNDILRYGSYNGVPRWWCKKCKRKFINNQALPHMTQPKDRISASLSMYYEGMSFRDIARHLQQQYGVYPAASTIFRWVEAFTKTALDATKDVKPLVSDTWVADETVIQIGGANVWLWDIIDSRTRYLLATHMSLSRTKEDAKTLVEAAAKRAGKTPKLIVTDQLNAYIDGIETAFGADTTHLQAGPFKADFLSNKIERFHGTLKDRTRVMRGLKTPQSANVILQGFLVQSSPQNSNLNFS